MNKCLFCRIVNGEIPSTKVYEDDLVYSFMDINPQEESLYKKRIELFPSKLLIEKS